MTQLHDLADAEALALAIVDTLPEPFLVLDEALCVLAGSRCFYEVFNEDAESIHGLSLFELSHGRWDVPGLQQLLTAAVADRTTLDAFEFEGDFAKGTRTIQINAHPIRDPKIGSRMMLLAIKDITERRIIEQEKQELLEHTERLLEEQKTLLREMQHRIANSLQIISSILLIKAGSVTSEETKNELRDAHRRVMSVADIQNHLHASDGIEQIEMKPYLDKLVTGLASSMIGPQQDIAINVSADPGCLPSSHAVSLGLIVTELIMNALKHAFPESGKPGRLKITFEKAKADWKLTVSDNGVGRGKPTATPRSTGLGTAIVKALAQQLDARITEPATKSGLVVEVTRATFVSRLPRAA
jgi:two-component sensor histidine kinase